MNLYIDPGTGSMLFTLLIGLLGAAIYAFRSGWMKFRFLFRAGRPKTVDEKRLPFVFFTDTRRYESIFRPILSEMSRRGQPVAYWTMDPLDPILSDPPEGVSAEFIGAGQSGFARMNMLRADLVLSSTPGLDVYQWKRSRDASFYVHIQHMPNDITRYRMFGIDAYDALLLNGAYETRQIRQLEEIRSLPPKEVILAGLPQLDGMLLRLEKEPPPPAHPTTVLLASSWGPSSIFSRYGARIFKALLATPHRLIFRPHPQSLSSEKAMIDGFMRDFPPSDRVTWDLDPDNFASLRAADLLISDFSGVIFDFGLVFEKPVIYAEAAFDTSIYDAWWIEQAFGELPWTVGILESVGVKLTPDNVDSLADLIDSCLRSPRFSEAWQKAREETWVNPGRSVPLIADYLIQTREKLLAKASAPPSVPDPNP